VGGDDIDEFVGVLEVKLAEMWSILKTTFQNFPHVRGGSSLVV
jgi:hypothetical protein